MKLVTVILAGDVRWNIKRGDPPLTPIKSLGDWHLIDPLAVPDTPNNELVGLYAISKDQAHLITARLFFQCPDDASQGEETIDAIVSFLRTLRLVSKQANLPTNFMAISYSEFDALEERQFPQVKQGARLIGQFRLDTAITLEIITEADRAGLTPNIAICHEILLDALRAQQQGDYRQAILFAAIAVESLARTTLEKEYQRVLSASPAPSHVNVVEIQTGGGKVVKKDPIYAYLSAGDNFQKLLHEMPLYLLRRSLVRDDHELYRRTKSLYATRNHIGHGDDAAADNLLTIDRAGGMAALDTAIATFSWFGATGYVLPVPNAVPLPIH